MPLDSFGESDAYYMENYPLTKTKSKVEAFEQIKF